jgi:stage III sporulation protein AA
MTEAYFTYFDGQNIGLVKDKGDIEKVLEGIRRGFESLYDMEVTLENDIDYERVYVDERSEIAGCYQGIPQNDVGVRTDILDGCPKATGIIMLIRSMSPDVIITDEIGKPMDVMAIEDALNAGITIITTAHSHGLEDVIC